MKRRSFVKKIGGATPIALFGGNSLGAFSKITQRHITILHTNDTHSHIDPFGPSHHRNANKGGIARRAVLIDQIRKENPNTLLLMRRHLSRNPLFQLLRRRVRIPLDEYIEV